VKIAAGCAEVDPSLKIEVVSFDPAAPATGNMADIALVTAGNLPEKSEGHGWSMVVGRDVIVPVFNPGNPYLTDLVRQGVSADELSGLFSGGSAATWSALLGGAKEKAAKVYVDGDAALTGALGRYLRIDESLLKGRGTDNGEAVLKAVSQDIYSIGFCRLSDLTAFSDDLSNAGIALLPIDRNGNGRMDYIENIYENVDALSRGIWIGKYPKELSRNIYALTAAKPADQAETGLLKYVLTHGQASLEMSGFNSLYPAERLSKIDDLSIVNHPVVADGGLNLIQLLVTLAAGLLLLAAVLLLTFRFRTNSRRAIRNLDPKRVTALNPENLVVPGGLYFDKSHTWAFMEKDGMVRVGIDDFIQHVTGGLTSIRLKNPGDKVRKGEALLTLVQKGKRLTINAPVSGIIRAENITLFNDPSLLNSAPYTQGWIYQIEPTNWIRETQFLLMAEKYTEWMRSEFNRLKDFLARAVTPEQPQYACVVLQDGGEITDHVLENLGPEVWEDFQTQFIDTSK
jgi:glycine cleavage system H lipoate-binding protein